MADVVIENPILNSPDPESPTQKCAICADAPARSVFSDPGGHVFECCKCGLRYAERYPDLTAAEGTAYGPEYFRKAIENSDRRAVLFGALLQEIEGFTGRKGRLLDIGTGDGGLVKAAAERGWEVEGTEIAQPMLDFVGKLGVRMHRGELEDLDLPHRHYDAIVLNHVLEHVRNPVRTLRVVERLLRLGGVVRIEVPNVASLSSRIKDLQSRLHMKRTPWKHYSTGHHYWFFTPRTLRAAFEAAGLRVLELRAPARQWPPLWPTDRVLNSIYRWWPLGGHLVAYGRSPRPVDP